MSQPLLSMREGMYLAEEPSSSGAGPPAVSFYENDGILKFQFSRAGDRLGLLQLLGTNDALLDEIIAEWICHSCAASLALKSNHGSNCPSRAEARNEVHVDSMPTARL